MIIIMINLASRVPLQYFFTFVLSLLKRDQLVRIARQAFLFKHQHNTPARWWSRTPIKKHFRRHSTEHKQYKISSRSQFVAILRYFITYYQTFQIWQKRSNHGIESLKIAAKLWQLHFFVKLLKSVVFNAAHTIKLITACATLWFCAEAEEIKTEAYCSEYARSKMLTHWFVLLHILAYLCSLCFSEIT